MENEELKNFEIRTLIGMGSSTSPSARFSPRPGQLFFNAAERKFTVTWDKNNISPLELTQSQLFPLLKKECPSGTCYIIRFENKPGLIHNELLVTKLDEGNKTLIHRYLFKLVGVHKGKLNKLAPGGNQVPVNEHFPDLDTSHKSISTNQSSFSQFNNNKHAIVAPSPFLTAGPGHHSSPLNMSQIRQRQAITPSIPSTSKSPSSFPYNNIKRANDKIHLNQIKTPLRRAPSQPYKPSDLFDNGGFSPSPEQKRLRRAESNTPKPSASPEFSSNKENEIRELLIVKPLDELDLPAKYTHRDFWMNLKLDEKIRSGARGEWIKGQDEQLTVEGLLCLKDGEWLNADIIDTYLHYICQKSERAQYIPTYAILSFDRKKKIPSAWYWKLQGVEIVLAPAHLNNNHWAMAVVNIPERTIHIMDSMNNGFIGETKREFMETILAILMEVSAQQDLAPEKMGNVEDWTREELLEVPQQKNGTDCGIFALLFARFAVSRRSPDFEQGHIPYYRRRICYDIVDPITNGTENGQT